MVLLIALLLQNQAVDAAKAQVDVAQAAFLDCVIANMPRADDGKSDAGTIADAVLARCHLEQAAYDDSLRQVAKAMGLDPRDRRMAANLRKVHETERSTVVDAVAKMRRGAAGA
jgi:hypothetical protein